MSGLDNVQVVDITASLNAVETIRQHHPDLTLIYMPCSWNTMLDLTRTITSQMTDTKIIILGAPDGDNNYLQGIEAGASACLPESASFDCLQQAISAVNRGEVICTPRLAYCLFERLSQLAGNGLGLEEDASECQLTLRELEILDLIAGGKNNQDIAEDLNLSVAVVKKRVHNILEKMRVRRSQLSSTALKRRSVSRRTPTTYGRSR
jgi:DNA-binding NarL/FixJ family response regulator